MAKLLKWNAPHVKLETIEKITGKTYATFREYRKPDFGFPISIRVERKNWDRLQLTNVFKELGLADAYSVYINL